jgi:hypothetical protein
MLAAMVVVAAGLAVGAIAPAAAATPQLLVDPERVSYTGASSALARKSASVDCPAGKVVVGAGWTTYPSSSELLVEDLIPAAYSVTAVVREDETGYGSNWSLTVHAVCAVRPPGWTIVPYLSVVDSNIYKQIVVDCPPDTVLLGGGFTQSDQTGQVVLTDLNFGSTAVSVIAYEDDTGTALLWALSGHAICADEPLGWEWIPSTNQTTYPTTSELSACPAGKMAISVGGDLDYAYGEVTLKGLKTFSYGGTDYGMALAAEDEDGAPTAWDLIAEVVCVSV